MNKNSAQEEQALRLKKKCTKKQEKTLLHYFLPSTIGYSSTELSLIGTNELDIEDTKNSTTDCNNGKMK
jgi:hypothetical protein